MALLRDASFEKLIGDLKGAVARPALTVVVAGPPGSGKRVAIAHAMNGTPYTVRELWLETSCLNEVLMQLERASGETMLVPPNRDQVPVVTVLHGLEIFEQRANEVFAAARGHKRLIVVVNDPTGLDLSPPVCVLRVRGFSWAAMD